MGSFTELEAWKQSRKIRNIVSDLVKKFPVDEKFRLADQIIRSSRSIGNNLAEGHGRFHYQDNIRFCIVARGSLTETLDHLIIALDEKIITEEILQSFHPEYESCLKLINGYIQYLKSKKMGE
ncbi:four helix bundle protein [Mucilaginibacter pallidiroseus]|uniref:Four helix bundle protein n=1 Tax=Mucilaginibacter pallidiroseus TaxID=2599295 RepID=A0A563UBQ6_9SPHI|nr:four helix bundle protein [Mucilaginibacter pallidiroseus]TWR28808.1 four helix bundle protein [Mucilaginibacter pallidiroseus]